MFKSDLLPMKLFKFSSPFSPVIVDQYLFIFVKLKEDNICFFYNFPFMQTCHYVLMSLATMKLTLVCMDKFVTIILTSLMTKITQSFSIFREESRYSIFFCKFGTKCFRSNLQSRHPKKIPTKKLRLKYA